MGDTHAVVRFGGFALNLRTSELRKNGVKVRLQDQPLQILAMLVERPGELVTREQIQGRLWPNDTAVDFEYGINSAVTRLRTALNDSARAPRYIETLTKRGYRFIAPISTETNPVEPAPVSPLVGTVSSRYRILERLGSGGMGVVYRAEDTRLGRFLALKFLPEDLAGHPATLDRFQREARAASALNHPNICTIYEVDELGGQPFIAMELLEGQTLRDRIAGKPLELGELLDLGIQAADALDAAHHCGVTHRDIKPANVFVTSRGQIKILDFGLAKLTQGVPSAPAGLDAPVLPVPPHSLTSAGVAMGTPAYMSPEQARGEEPDTRTDLFSFGAVLYEMATGQQAFGGPSPSLIHDAILIRNPPPPSSLNPAVPPKLDEIIHNAIEKDREFRCQSAAELCADLKRLKRDIDSGRNPGTAEAVEPASGPSAEILLQDAPRGPLRFWRWGAAAAALIVVAATIVKYTASRETRPAGIAERQLTASFAAPVTDAAISPDGTSLAYADTNGLYLKLIASGEVHPLAKPANCRVFQIAWFPNSRDILVTAMPGQSNLGALWAISVFGGQPRLLREDTRDVSVSPDASQIAFTTNAQDGLWIMNADGSQAKRVASAPPGQIVAEPAWRKARRSVFYLSKSLSSRADPSKSPVVTRVLLESLDLETGRTTVIRKADSFCVLPGGRVIAAGLPGGLGIFAADSPDSQPVYLASHDASRDSYFFSRVSVSADGRQLVVLKTIAEGAVFAARLTDGGKRLENVRRMTTGGPESSAHAWTPDSRAIVFESNRENVYHIFSQRLDQQSPDRLVGGDTPSVDGRFSPDGRWLFYEACTDHNTLMRVAPSGGPSRVVLDTPNLTNFYCAGAAANFCVAGVRNQEELVFYRLDPNQEPPAGGFPLGALRKLGRTDYHPSDWGISPDGSTVAMVKPDDREGRIHLVALAGQHDTRNTHDVVVKGWANFYSMNWALDGNGWYVSNQPARGGPSFLYVERGGQATVLYAGASSTPIWGVPSPDGRYLAICASPGITNAWLIENF